MSLIRTQCSGCLDPVFWGSDCLSPPECRGCRELREGLDDIDDPSPDNVLQFSHVFSAPRDL